MSVRLTRYPQHPETGGVHTLYICRVQMLSAELYLVCPHPSFRLIERRFYLIEPTSDHPVKVTAEERTHPAIRKLARACIALARQLSGEASSHSVIPTDKQPEEKPAIPDKEEPNA